MHFDMPLEVKGHVKITDDLGTVLLDNDNAVHPQNMARIIARALSNESNYFVSRIAFGNGGTTVDGTGTITFLAANDGQTPDVRTWDSRIYNETYSEIVDEGNTALNTLLGTDPGSAGPNAIRAGGGADPSGDPASIPHVSGPGVHSNELGLTSEVVITSVLNPGEPKGQLAGDSGSGDIETSFSFDEIGLYTEGAPASDSNGTQDLDVGEKNSSDITNMSGSTAYTFNITVDGGTPTVISFTTPPDSAPVTGFTYGQLCEAINTGDAAWGFASGISPLPAGSTISITDYAGIYGTISGAQTYGFLRFTSGTTGLGSSIVITDGNLFTVFPGTPTPAVDGKDAGDQNNPTISLTERERLLTHIIFSPVLKSANRTLTVTYTLTISVARST